MRFHELHERAAERSIVNSFGRPIAADPQSIASFWQWFGKSRVKDRSGRPIVVFHGTTGNFNAFNPQTSNANTNTGVPHGTFFFTDNTDVAVSYITADADNRDFASPQIKAQFQELMRTGTFDQQMEFLHDNPTTVQPIYKDDGHVMPVYLRIAKPLIVDAKGDVWHDVYFKPKGQTTFDSYTTNEIALYAQENGYDGMIVKRVKDVHKGEAHSSTIYAVFSPNQIKSAIANRGTYSDGDSIDESGV